MENVNIRPMSIWKGIGYLLLFYLFQVVFLLLGFGIYVAVKMYFLGGFNNIGGGLDHYSYFFKKSMGESFSFLMLFAVIFSFFTAFSIYFREQRQNVIKSLKSLFSKDKRVLGFVWVLAIPIVIFLKISCGIQDYLVSTPEFLIEILKKASFGGVEFFSIVLVAPIFEELFFRGIILNSLERRYSGRIALIFSSILFSVYHLVPYQMIYAFFIGIFLGWIYKKSGSLKLSIFCHFVMNFSSLVIIWIFQLAGEELPLNEAASLSDLPFYLGSLLLFGVTTYFLNKSLKKVVA